MTNEIKINDKVIWDDPSNVMVFREGIIKEILHNSFIMETAQGDYIEVFGNELKKVTINPLTK